MAGIIVAISSTLIAALKWFLSYYKAQIEKNLRKEFRHEIDRIVTEQNHLLCFLETNMPGYERLQISGEYRSVFYQSCSYLDENE
jgi:hypothetical protein